MTGDPAPVDAVTALVHTYAERLDGGDLDGVAALFAQATWRAGDPPRAVEGAEAVRRMYDPVMLYDGVPRTKHVISNSTVEVAENGRTARARSYFTVLQATDDFPLQPIIAGRYQDAFALDDDGWHFTDRLIVVDLLGDVSRHYRGRGL